MAQSGNKQNSKPWQFGTPHPTLQKYECEIQTYEDLMRRIPSEDNPISNWNVSASANDVDDLPTADRVSTWFRGDDQVAFYGPPTAGNNQAPMTYAQLQTRLSNIVPFDTSQLTASKVAVVGILLPPCYMAEMAVVLMTLLNQHNEGIAIAPIDPNMAHPKLMSCLQQLQCSALVTTKELYESLQSDPWVGLNLVDVRVITQQSQGIIGAAEWTTVQQPPRPLKPTLFSNLVERPALLLRTSGTTSLPKLVPLTAKSLLYNATCLAASLQLTPDDVGCNVMPLFHIGGISCALLSVLISGSSVVMMPGPFEATSFVHALTTAQQQDGVKPTWYYGAPSVHKAVLWTAQSIQASNGKPLESRLRFIRSGAAHLPHETAVALAEVFAPTRVMPTYSMSECMPVCSCHDAPVFVDEKGEEVARPGVTVDTVGVPIGSSLAVLNKDGQVVLYGEVGEISLKGPGVMTDYLVNGVGDTERHTTKGDWFRTGDMGTMDSQGRVVLVGRTKEMIKRGGEQVWPNEVDSVVEKVPGVLVAVTFGVTNELWGEEVQVAVALEDSYKDTNQAAISEEIKALVADELGDGAKPSQVIFVESVDRLLKGPTGKYLRTKMADHLGVKAVDTGALRAFQAMVNGAEGTSSQQDVAKSSDALNGVRFIVACYVVQHHMGKMPNNAWLRIQAFSMNMSIFFMLAAFQLTTATKSEVRSSAAQFIGTKIGSMQPFFIVSQVLGMASFLLMDCGATGYSQTFNEQPCSATFGTYFPPFVVNTFTGALGIFDSSTNGPAWFQNVFYTYLIIFPILDWHLRSRKNSYKVFVLVLNLAIASTAFLWLPYMLVFSFRLATWMPALVASMIAGYFFIEYGPTLQETNRNEKKHNEDFAASATARTPEALPLLKRATFWGIVADVVTLVFLVFEILVAIAPDCIYMGQEFFMAARPGEEPEWVIPIDGRNYAWVCDVSHDEFITYVHGDPWNTLNMGRWGSTFFGTALQAYVGFGRLGSPLVLIWIFGLAYGKGLTARFFNSRPLQLLGPFAYPLYLLHLPVARCYWVATRGHVAQWWWSMASAYPVPVEWWEVFIIIAICVALAWVLDLLVVRHLVPYAIRAYVWLFRLFARCCCCTKNNPCSNRNVNEEASVFEQVKRMVSGLTGNKNVTGSTNLRDLGLDSMGATALLGTLRACVPAAKTLTMGKLATCETIDDLLSILEEENEATKSEDVEPPV